MKDKLIASGVKSINRYGYPGCNKDNILTDQIYKAFFASMLKDNKGFGADKAIDELLSALES